MESSGCQPPAGAASRGLWLRNWGGLLATLVAGSVVGCEGKDTAKAELPAPMVTVATPVEREVTHYEFFTGRVVAPEKVEIRAKVSGYLIKIYFKRGTEVAKGAPLFEIDPQTFKDDVAQSVADLARSEALPCQSTTEFNRVKGLRDQGASSQEEFEKNLGKKQEAEATVQADRAKVARAKLNLSYCSIKAPIAGRIGDTLVTEGNLVEGGLGT